MEENRAQLTLTAGSIINPSSDIIIKKIGNPFLAINLTKKRCCQLNFKLKAGENDEYVTISRLITKVFQEIVSDTISFSIEQDGLPPH